MAAGDFIQILAGGQRLFGPERVVPVAAGEPVACGCGFGKVFDLGLHLGEGLDPGQIEIQLHSPGLAQMHMGIIESWKDKGAGA